MNMVSLLGLGLVLSYNFAGVNPDTGKITTALEAGKSTAYIDKFIEPLKTNWPIGLVVALVALALMIWALWNSKRESADMKALDAELSQAAEGQKNE
jgi:uncharacterized membrane protein AbrB (regulator of aidB expression)